MKLQRQTWILVALALCLGGFVYFYEIQGSSKREIAQEQEKELFDFEEKQIQAVTIEKPKQTLVFEREEDENHPWQMKKPEDERASEASVAFLLDLIAQGKRDRAFSAPVEKLKDYGLTQPLATVTVRLKDREESHVIILGKPNFDEKFLYARIDPPETPKAEAEVALIPIDFKYAVEREFEEWKAEEGDEEVEEAGGDEEVEEAGEDEEAGGEEEAEGDGGDDTETR
ncbi:DUF4340 domain-containing protein [Lusitaniella coriacea]|uniref:DUF4340 domain-containing protein n=1 Tax=Lusitaniella coriacea TaxID=1983105 RepID=UPI003CF393B9